MTTRIPVKKSPSKKTIQAAIDIMNRDGFLDTALLCDVTRTELETACWHLVGEGHVRWELKDTGYTIFTLE